MLSTTFALVPLIIGRQLVELCVEWIRHCTERAPGLVHLGHAHWSVIGQRTQYYYWRALRALSADVTSWYYHCCACAVYYITIIVIVTVIVSLDVVVAPCKLYIINIINTLSTLSTLSCLIITGKHDKWQTRKCWKKTKTKEKEKKKNTQKTNHTLKLIICVRTLAASAVNARRSS